MTHRTRGDDQPENAILEPCATTLSFMVARLAATMNLPAGLPLPVAVARMEKDVGVIRKCYTYNAAS